MDGAVFDLIRRARNGGAAVLCAFDLIELDGEDLRRAPIEHRKHKLARSCSSTPASSAAKASFQSGSARPIAPGARRIGSRSKTRKRRQSNERPKRIGAVKMGCGLRVRLRG
jgi:hypothetical protein